MKKMIRGLFIGILSLSVLLPSAGAVKADSVSVKPYIAFGADLTTAQKKTVMDELNISGEELADYEVVEVTNEEEHQYLGEYLDASVIGTRALSSVMVEEVDYGSGVTVETHNISFCTEEMYTNALVTAGIQDAMVTVAAPFEISGTAALVGAMKAYGVMTGEEIDSANADAATNELVFTGELGNEIGTEKAAQLVAIVKDMVIDGDITSESEIMGAIETASTSLKVKLSEEQKQKLIGLMKKIGGLDLDISVLQEQAEKVYDKMNDVYADLGGAEGIWEQICDFFAGLFEAIAEFFKGLF